MCVCVCVYIYICVCVCVCVCGKVSKRLVMISPCIMWSYTLAILPWVSNLFYGTGPHPLLWAGSRAARGKIITDLRNCLNYCEIFVVRTQFTDVPAGRIIQPGAPRVLDPCIRPYSKAIPVPNFTHRNFLVKSLQYFPLTTTTTTTTTPAYGVKVIYSVHIFLPKWYYINIWFYWILSLGTGKVDKLEIVQYPSSSVSVYRHLFLPSSGCILLAFQEYSDIQTPEWHKLPRLGVIELLVRLFCF